MSWREGRSLGEQYVKEAHDLLRVDDHYTVCDANGFTWWSADFATRVSTDQGVFRQSQCLFRVTAETDMLKGRGHMGELAEALEHEMDECTFSGPVYDAGSDTIRLYCCVYANLEEAVWLRKAFAAAVALQVAEAYDMSRRLGQRFRAIPAASEHPTNGLRASHDPVIDQAAHFFHPSGDRPSRWLDDPNWERAGWIMEREARTFQTDRRSGLSASFDWGCSEGAIALEVRTDEPHKALGNGLHATLTVPMALSAAAIGHLVLDLNTYEKAEYKRCHMLGSWCEHGGKLAYRTFFPNALYHPDTLEDVCVNMATRAIWVDEWFQEKKAAAGR